MKAALLTAAEVLYMEDGGPKRCDRCIMWIPGRDRCTIHRKKDVVTANMVCGLYVHGKPMGGTPTGEVTPQISDLGRGDTRCGNCLYGNGAPTCQHPCLDGFSIDNFGGCCNAWTTLPGHEA